MGLQGTTEGEGKGCEETDPDPAVAEQDVGSGFGGFLEKNGMGGESGFEGRELLFDAADGMDKAGHARVGTAEQGESGFDGSEAGVGEVLGGADGRTKPCVVGEVHEDLGATAGEIEGFATEAVFEANDGSDLDGGAVRALEVEQIGGLAWPDVSGNEIPNK